MRGIEKIVDQILGEAKLKVEEINKETEKEVLEILKSAEVDAEKVRNEILKSADEKVKNYEELAKLAAEQKRKQALLKAKQECIKDVISKAYKKLLELNDEEYFDLIEKMLEKFVQPKLDGEIIFNDKDKDRLPVGFVDKIKLIANQKGGNLVLSENTRKLDAGFVLVYGGIEENCTFKALLESGREELQDIVNMKLFNS